MPNAKSHGEDPRRRPQRTEFEQHCAYVIAILDSPKRLHPSKRFEQALAGMNSTLLAMAHVFFRSERNICRRQDLANDAVATWHMRMLAKGYRSYRVRRTGLPFGPYAIRSLHNICVSMMRRLNRDRSVALIDECFDRRADPRDAAQVGELRQECRRAMKSLAPDLRECLRLIYWEGLSGREIAERMGTNPRTVATWHSRGLRRVADEFRNRGCFPL